MMSGTQGSGEIPALRTAAEGLLIRHNAPKRENGRLRALDVKPGSEEDSRPAEFVSCTQRQTELGWGALRGRRRMRRATGTQQMVQD